MCSNCETTPATPAPTGPRFVKEQTNYGWNIVDLRSVWSSIPNVAPHSRRVCEDVPSACVDFMLDALNENEDKIDYAPAKINN